MILYPIDLVHLALEVEVAVESQNRRDLGHFVLALVIGIEMESERELRWVVR